ncbi:quinone oxidoreductase family protein [Mycobacterium stomatepiae]|uniref:Enoyl reductase (ER) domain-containing protein n=1 Tax=Mycobacterium stomatepiae TaxID=470076 RepID=A0A7I7QB09_9MYCO|nr:zinc-binding dehydrogenase [Mycobacterium stomatepiae]BBY23237.1 hypothetical protein MSTO_34420 [Mycobacterium stomatepiae]
MKAVSYDRFGGPEVLEYVELPDPTPGTRQLLIETAAVGVNFPDIACAHLLLQASTTLRAGESLLVHGAAGGVGSLAVQIGKALGAGPVIGTASTAQRREFVKALGADAAISYDEPGWTEQVRELTSGRGVDVLIESIGGEVSSKTSTRWLLSAGICCSVPLADPASRSRRAD